MVYKTIIRIKYGKENEILKICEDFKKTSEGKGEPFEYEIKGNKLIITKNRDVKQACRRKYWFEWKKVKDTQGKLIKIPRFPELVIYGVVKEEKSNGI